MPKIYSVTTGNCNGHYSPAIIHNNIAYISGQLPLRPTSKIPQGTIAEQTALALDNLKQVLEQCNSNENLVLKTTVYISNIDFWPEVNQVYSKFFANHKPARTIVPTSTLHFGSLIEIDAIAAIKSNN